jgi:hypothetical protein
MHTLTRPIVLLCCGLGVSCADNLQVPYTNVTPVAVASILNDARKDASFTLGDQPVSVTLDASMSRDLDGEVRTYRWLSATTPDRVGSLLDDAGAHGRWVPEGAAADWPDDVIRPEITLSEPGDYAFTLWVVDDRGRISDPSTISLRVVRP